MELTGLSRLQHYLKYRRRYEVVLFLLVMSINSASNITAQLIQIARLHLSFQRWEPFAWAYTSDMATLVLIPFVILLSRRIPISWRTLRTALPIHLLAALTYWTLHVIGMTAFRKLVYELHGMHFDFVELYGGLQSGLLIEFMADVRAYVATLIAIQTYRFVLLRLQGEAAVLDPPDIGPPVESIERPQRFLVRKLGKEFLVNVTDIERLEAQGNYVNLHVRGRAYPLRSTMASIETKLDPAKFVRVHRSHMINLDHLIEIEPLDTGDARLKLRDETLVPCSRNYRSALKERNGTHLA